MTAILVTGASGFVGSALCLALDSHGHLVRCAGRRLPDKQRFASFAVGDIGPDTNWNAALSGCELVVHLAAHVHVMRPQPAHAAAAYHRVNVEGSEQLARQAARAGVRRFVFLSSVKVNGDDSGERAFVESDPVRPRDAYGESKAEAERRLWRISAETGMQIVILRPPLVYGAGVRANFLSLLRTVDAGIPLPFRSIENRRSLIYVGNLIHALEACLTVPGAANRTFFASDDHDLSTPQLIWELAFALGRRPLLYPMPPALLRGIGMVTGRAEQIARLTGSLQVDVSAIKTMLDWQPPFSVRQGMQQTAAWYRSLRSH